MAKQANKKTTASRSKKEPNKSRPPAAKTGTRAGTSARSKRAPEPSAAIDIGGFLDRFLEFIVRDDTIGVILLIMSARTFFSLISPRGSLTEGWIQGLSRGVGIMVWLLPVLFGAVGLWLVLRRVASHRAPAWYRIAGLIVLFLVMTVLAHLASNSADPATLANQGGGGGRLGYVVSQFLVGQLGTIGTAIVLLMLTLIGLALIVGPSSLRSLWARLRGHEVPAEQPPPLLVEPLPITPEPPSLLQRSRQWLIATFPRLGGGSAAEADAAGTLDPRVVGSAPLSGATWYEQATARSASGAPGSTAVAAQARPGSPASPTFPRVAGGPSAWRLPLVDDILDEGPEQELSAEDLARRARLIEDTLRSFGVPVTVVEVNRGPAVTQFGLRPDFVKKRYRRSDVEVRQEAAQRLRSLTRNERAQLEADARTRLSRAGNDYPTPEQLEAQMLDLLAGSVDRYMEKDVKIKVARIQALSNDLALALEAAPIRIEAPVPGRSIVGLEVPNLQTTLVSLRSVLESEAYRVLKSPLKLPLGQDVSGQPAVADMVRMPHLLIAGATGSGKSVCVNSLIASLLFSHTPDTLRFLMVDPKMVELTTYNGIPHLIAPVVTEVDRVVPVLAWATREMDRRYKLFSHTGARNIDSYNEKMTARHEPILPFIIIIIDELADLMMAAPDEVERYICRLAQMARATGIHLILATQRPSVDVVTGLIKANFPARIAFAVTSQIDSRVILDTPGAERLLGRGDMLFMEPTSPNLARLQGCFVSDHELHQLVEHWQRAQAAQLPTSDTAGGEEPLPGSSPRAAAPAAVPPETHAPVAAFPRGLSGTSPSSPSASHTDEVPVSTMPPPGTMIQPPMFEEMFGAQSGGALPGRDALYDEAVSIVREANRASVSLLQRRLRVGYTRAARLIEMMEADGIVGPDQGGSRGRDVVPAARDANS